MEEEIRKWVKKKMAETDALKGDLDTLKEMKAVPKASTEKSSEPEEAPEQIEEEPAPQPIEQTPIFEMPAIPQAPAQANEPVLQPTQNLETPVPAEYPEQPSPTLSLTESQFSTMKRAYPPKTSILSKKTKVLLAIIAVQVIAILFIYFYAIPYLSSTG